LRGVQGGDGFGEVEVELGGVGGSRGRVPFAALIPLATGGLAVGGV
jgi:hypothetical protein